jgi:hypothetical protein
MNGILHFLNRHQWFSITAGVIYFSATVLLHKVVANLSLDVEKKVTYASYNKGWGLFAIIGLFSISLTIIFKILKSKDRGFKFFFLSLTAALIAASHLVVLAVNLEYIHIMQFSLLVFPVFVLSKRFGETVFWIGLLGAVDELCQYYVVWWPHQSYFDFNDITMDIVGGFFMVFLISLWVKKEIYFSSERNKKRKWTSSPVPIVAATLIILALIANLTGYMRFYPKSGGNTESRPIILLSNDPPASGFWSVFEKGKTYHIQGAVEWMLILLFLTGVYSLLDWRFQRTAGPPQAFERKRE